LRKYDYIGEKIFAKKFSRQIGKKTEISAVIGFGDSPNKRVLLILGNENELTLFSLKVLVKGESSFPKANSRYPHKAPLIKGVGGLKSVKNTNLAPINGAERQTILPLFAQNAK